MNSAGLQSERGFTLMELLIVIAIIGVLVGVSVPLVGDQIDQARRNHDIACVEDAVAAAKAEFAYDYDGQEGMLRVYAFDVSSGEASATDPSQGYGQWGEEADYSVGGVPVEGVAQDSFVSCVVIDGDVTMLQWGSLTPGALYRRGVERYADKSVELAANTSRERLIIDADTIKAMASTFLGLTESEILAKANLPSYYSGRLTNDEGLVIFTYENRNQTSPRLKGSTAVLESLGFSGPVSEVSSNSFSNSSVRAFFSDFMNSGAEVQVVVGKFKFDSDGKAVGLKAWCRVYDKSSVFADAPAQLAGIYISQ